jgi:hypothetical protein
MGFLNRARARKKAEFGIQRPNATRSSSHFNTSLTPRARARGRARARARRSDSHEAPRFFQGDQQRLMGLREIGLLPECGSVDPAGGPGQIAQRFFPI